MIASGAAGRARKAVEVGCQSLRVSRRMLSLSCRDLRCRVDSFRSVRCRKGPSMSAKHMTSVSLFRYWMHRWQHNNEFLWSLHSYHHRVTDLKATNGEVSNPVDFALRNVVVFLVLGVIGFNTFAVLLAFTVTNVTAVFSHCG